MGIQCLAAKEQQPAATAPKPSPVREVIVIIKTHFDIGYTHRVKEIVHHYRTDMIDQAMNIMDQSKNLPPEQQFAWTGPGWVMSKVLEDWDGQTPERTATARRLRARPASSGSTRCRSRSNPMPASRRKWPAASSSLPTSAASTACRCRAPAR